MRSRFAREVANLKATVPRGQYVTTDQIIDLMGWRRKNWCDRRTVAYIMKRAGAVLIEQSPFTHAGFTLARSIWMFPQTLPED
jgi:hypothetical protein